MSQISACLVAFLFCVAGLQAQTDGVLSDTLDGSGPKRKPNGEWLFGITTANLSYTLTTTEWNGYEEVPVGDSMVRDERIFVTFGYGAHIPLVSLGRLSTLSLVPAVTAAISVSGFSTSAVQDPQFRFDLSLPIHVAVGYGGLRRKALAWGVEGGLGINATRRFYEGVFTVAPSAIVDVTYAPRNIYRLRFMADLSSYTVEQEGGFPYSMQTWSLMLVVGF